MTMLCDIDRESQPQFRAGSGTVGTDVARLGCADAQQTVTVTGTGGTYKLAVRSVPTDDIAFDALAAAVETALEAVVGSGNVAVSGDAGGPYTVDFTNAEGGQAQAAMGVGASGLVGEGAGVVVTLVKPGHDVGYVVRKYVVVRANGANTDVITIGTGVANAADGFILSAGQISPPIYVDNLNKVYLKGGAAGQNYSWIAC